MSATLLLSVAVAAPVDDVTPSVGATVDVAGAVVFSGMGSAVLAAGDGEGSFLYILLPRRTSFSRNPGFFSSVAGVEVASTGDSVAFVVPLVALVTGTDVDSVVPTAVASVTLVLSFLPNPRKEDMRRDDPVDWPADGRTAGPSWCRAGGSAAVSKGLGPVGP